MLSLSLSSSIIDGLIAYVLLGSISETLGDTDGEGTRQYMERERNEVVALPLPAAFRPSMATAADDDYRTLMLTS